MDFQSAKQVPCYGAGDHAVSALAFDLQEELLWIGTSGGHISSYCGPNMDKYTAFQANTEGIRQLLPYPAGLLSLTATELRCTARTGLMLDTIKELEGMSELQSMLLLDEGTVLLGSQSGRMLTLDLVQRSIQSQVFTEGEVCLLKASEHHVCCGEVSGMVGLHDPRTLQRIHTLTTHNAGLFDMEVVGPYLVTCGLTQQYSQVMSDNELVVYDMRMQRRLPNTTLSLLHPLLLRCMPAYPSCILVLSQLGRFQLVDLHGLVTPTSMLVHQLEAEGAPPTALDISPSCMCIGFGDSAGVCHLWTAGPEPIFNPYAQPTIFPDNPAPPPFISWDEENSAPLSTVPMPPSTGPLLSDWPETHSRPCRRKHPKIPREILSNMKITQFVGHAPRPAWLLRNQCPYNDLNWPSELQDFGSDDEEMPSSPMMRASNPLSIVPKSYRPVQIKYSKLGIEQFNFHHYNSTNFAGLEIHIPNAYCNSMLQVLYFLEPIRCAMQNHQCPREFCLSCELGFLFQMLDDCSAGNSCQASNFLRVFRTLREAAALGLLITREEEESQADLCKLIQNWTRFVFQQLNQELQQDTHMGGMSDGGAYPSVMETVFGTRIETSSVCRCGRISSRSSTDLLFSLNYPDTGLGDRQLQFTDVLQQSICRKQQTHTWCDNCKKFKSTTQNKKLLKLPLVLVLNCGLDTECGRQFWRKQSNDGSEQWVPLNIKMSVLDDGELLVVDSHGSDQCEGGQASGHRACYELISAVSLVKKQVTGSSQPGNLVAHIRVGSSYHERKEDGVSRIQWYLFNDFSIQPIPETEAAVFSLDWLTPCVLVFAQRDFCHLLPSAVTRHFGPDLLLCETHPPGGPQQSFTPLSSHELPVPGDLVGLDTEFVSLNKEQAEVHSDWTSSMLKPSQLSVARITVVRGKGPAQGTAFVDDYIATSERVVDYLTRFSGINPGDLDPSTSSKHITTLKASYLKLLYLLEGGMTFVGHGLKKDFRVINILVPPNQVVDTVELFHLPKMRYISLRYLAWFYLGLRIQEETHDSVEDACTALLLYHKYLELQEQQTLSDSLHKLYGTGRKTNWKLPV